MKNKKIIISIVIILILMTIVIYIANSKKKNTQQQNIVSEINYDNENGIYYIKNEATGEIIANSVDEGGLQIYIDNPNYNPNPLRIYENTYEE